MESKDKMPDAGQMYALKRVMKFVGFSLYSLYFDVHTFSFPYLLMDFLSLCIKTLEICPHLVNNPAL
jgi:hypothetical protein